MISSIYNQFTSFGVKITSNISNQFISLNDFMEYLNKNISVVDTDKCEIEFDQENNSSLIAKYTGGIKSNKFDTEKGRLQIYGNRWPLIYVGGFKNGLFEGDGELQYSGKDRFEPSNDNNSEWNIHSHCDFFYRGKFKEGLFFGEGDVVTAYLSYPNYITLVKWKKAEDGLMSTARRYRCIYDENGICVKSEYIEPISHHIQICDSV